MAGCDIIPIEASGKACAGKCKNTCQRTPRLWVLAACDGMISMFEKEDSGGYKPLIEEGKTIFASLDHFHSVINRASENQIFDQLVIIGTPSDLSWLHAALPPSATRFIAAEILYPLLPAWFRQQPAPTKLCSAIEKILSA